MSFGISSGDIVLCIGLARKVWSEAMSAPKDFQNVAAEVASFKLVLDDVHASIQERAIEDKRRMELETLVRGCEDVLHDLQELLNSGTLARVERLLEQLTMEHRSGLREVSVISDSSIGSAEQGDSFVWWQISKELEDVGITSDMVAEHKDFIIAWLKRAWLSGEFDEATPHPSCSPALQCLEQPCRLSSPHSETSLSLRLNRDCSPTAYPVDTLAVKLYEINLGLVDSDLYPRQCTACKLRTKYTAFGEALRHSSHYHPSLMRSIDENLTFWTPLDGDRAVRESCISIIWEQPRHNNTWLPSISKLWESGTTKLELPPIQSVPTVLMPLLGKWTGKGDHEYYDGIDIFATPQRFLNYTHHQIRSIRSGKYLGFEPTANIYPNGLCLSFVDEDSAACFRVVKSEYGSYQIFAVVPETELVLSVVPPASAVDNRREVHLMPSWQVPQSKYSQWTLECMGQASSLFRIKNNNDPDWFLDEHPQGKLHLSIGVTCTSQLWSFLPGPMASRIRCE